MVVDRFITFTPEAVLSEMTTPAPEASTSINCNMAFRSSSANTGIGGTFEGYILLRLLLLRHEKHEAHDALLDELFFCPIFIYFNLLILLAEEL